MRAIDADELKENLKKWFPKFTLDGIEAKTLFNQILHDIDNAPTIPHAIITEFKGCDNCELKRPKGEWKETGYETGALGITYRQTQCSNCGWEHALPMWWNFCPNCGAEMQKGGTPNGRK